MIRGTVDAAGFILDVPTIGETEARGRVLAAWSAGASVRALPDGRWLLLLAAPVTMRAERAPGLVVVREGETLRAGGAELGGPGLVELRHGRELRHTALTPLEPERWLVLPPVVALRPLDARPTRVPIERPQPEPGPDLRAFATVEEPDPELRAELEQAPEKSGRLARMILRTPAAGYVGRRHRDYLSRLTQSFERGDYENALRDAIGLGGSGGGSWLSLRLPGRRTGDLRPSDRRPGGGGSVPWDDTAFYHLRRLYLKAAERLEQEGAIERAAFVHADLLDAPYDAVALLERHGRYALAARLAQARELAPVLAVSLWWRAGERDRALRLARARGGWSAALDRIDDPRLAQGLRAAWIDTERARDAHRSAIEVAWPDPELRDGIEPDLDALRALGGESRATAVGLALAWRNDEAALRDALALLAGATPHGVAPPARGGAPTAGGAPIAAGAPGAGGAPVADGATLSRAAERLALLETLAERPPADAATARRLAGQGVRAILRDGAAGELGAVRGGRALLHTLRGRADPLLRADLPAFKPAKRASGRLRVEAHPEPGGVEFHDAVLLDAGLLTAHGAHGLSLRRADGRELAHWEGRADRLVVADHGAAVLVVAYGESIAHLRRLELSTRRLTRVAALPDVRLLDTFDGATAVIVDQGIEGLDLMEDHPRTLWSELDSRTTVLAATRSRDHLSAIVDTPLQGRRNDRSIERWTWRLPARTIESRDVYSQRWAGHDARVTADGIVVWIDDDRLHTAAGETILLDAPTEIAISGDHFAQLSGDRVTVGTAAIDFPDAAATGFRVHGDVATIFSDDGRIVAFDLTTQELLVRLRLGPR